MNGTKLGWLSILLVMTVLTAALPVVGIAQDVGVEGEPTAINGCIATAQKPDVQNGEVVARAKVECPTALAGREIVVELWQKDGDEVFQLIPDATTTWEGADQVQPLHKADTSGIDCQDLDSGHRRYKTRIKISDGSGNFTQTSSLGQDLGRNCLAQSGVVTADLSEATESGEVTAEGEVTAATTYDERNLVNCRGRAYAPTWPQPGGRIYARGRFECVAGRTTGITYLRTRLLRQASGHLYKVEKSTATWFETDRSRTADLYASCKTESSSRRDYWTHIREYVEDNRGERVDAAELYSPGVIRSLKCV